MPPDNAGTLLGEYVVEFFPKWAEGKVILRGSSARPKAKKTIEIVQEGLHRIVFQTRWKRDEHGWRVRDADGQLADLGWGDEAAAWIPLREFDIEHVLALAEKVDEEGIGKEIWRKVRSFLKQLIDYAQLKKDFPRERANPVTLVAPPPQTGVKLVRRPYPPEIVERIRADFLALERISRGGSRRSRRNKIETPAGVPVPLTPDFASTSADLVEALAYGGFRPGEILAACGRHYAPEDLGPKYLRICQRNVDGVIVAGTKSSRYPDKDVFLLGPLPKTIRGERGRRASMASCSLTQGRFGSGRRTSTATGVRTTSCRSREAMALEVSRTIRTRSAMSTRHFGSRRTTRRSTSKAPWGRGSSAACTGG